MWRYFVLILPFFAANGVLPFVAGVVPGYYGWIGYSHDRDLRELGKLADAHITNRGKKGFSYHIKYSFVDFAGKEWSAERDLTAEYNEMVNTNDYFMMTYLPSNPAIHIIGDRSATSMRSKLAIGLIGIAILLCGWGGWGLGRSVWQLYRIRSLFKSGAVAVATVGASVNSARKATSGRDRMTFHFVATNGRWYEGRSRSFNLRFLNKWPKDSHIKVVYDPSKPGYSEPDVFKLLD